MPDYRQLTIDLLQDTFLKAKHFGKYPARTGKYNPSTDTYEPYLSELPNNKVYIRFYGVEAPVPAWNINKVNPLLADIPVWVGYDKNGELEVVEAINNSASDELGSGASVVITPPVSGDTSSLNVYQNNIYPLRAKIVSGFTIRINGYTTSDYDFPTTDIDLTSYKPSSGLKWIMVGFDPDSLDIVISESDILSPIFPNYDQIYTIERNNKAVYSVAVRLYAGASGLNNGDLKDIRNLFNRKNKATDIEKAIYTGGRLSGSLTNLNSVIDYTALTELYYVPYINNLISLNTGYDLTPVEFEALTIDLSPIVSGTNYDIFLYYNSGIAYELVAWTDDTTRDINIQRFNGVWVKEDEIEKRYIGSIRASANGETEDSKENRLISNAYNQVSRSLRLEDYTSHTYNGVLREYRGVTNRVGFITGINQYVYLGCDSKLKSASNGNQTQVSISQNSVINTTIATVESSISEFIKTSANLVEALAPGYYEYILSQLSNDMATFESGVLQGTIWS